MAIEVLAVSGSLRKQSTNTRLLEELSKYADDEINIKVFSDIEDIPPFNPDREDCPTAITKKWLKEVKDANIFIVSTPEYAHGIPGSLKNALDWLVSTDAFIEKLFSIYSVCPRPVHCPQALLEVLTTMSGVHIKGADITVDLNRNIMTAEKEFSKRTNIEKIKKSICILKTIEKY